MYSLLRSAAALAAAAALVTGCSSGDDWSRPHPEPTAVGKLGPGFVDPSSPPAPEGNRHTAARLLDQGPSAEGLPCGPADLG